MVQMCSSPLATSESGFTWERNAVWPQVQWIYWCLFFLRMLYPSQRTPTGRGFKVSSCVLYSGWKETYFRAYRCFVLQWMWKCITLSRNNQGNKVITRRWWALNSSSTTAEDKPAEQPWPWRRTDLQLTPTPLHNEFSPALKSGFSLSTGVFCGGSVVKWPVCFMFHVVPFSLFRVKHHRTVLTVLQGQFCEETPTVVSHIWWDFGDVWLHIWPLFDRTVRLIRRRMADLPCLCCFSPKLIVIKHLVELFFFNYYVWK